MLYDMIGYSINKGYKQVFCWTALEIKSLWEQNQLVCTIDRTQQSIDKSISFKSV
jgi:hypothetical protein